MQHRVDALADRPEGYRLEGAAGFSSFVPLPEILGEIAGVGPKSKSVAAQVSAMVDRFGPELGILGDVPLDDLAAGAPSIVAEAIARLRRGEVRREAGYDGVYGTIRLFDPDELSGAALFDVPKALRKSPQGKARASAAAAATELPAQVRRRGPRRAPGLPLRWCGQVAWTPSSTRSSPMTAARCSSWPDRARARPGCSPTRSRTGSATGCRPNAAWPSRSPAAPATSSATASPRCSARTPPPQVTVATFHGLGLLILREQCKLLGLDADLKVADEKTRHEILRLLSERERPAAVGARIAAAKRANSFLPLLPESLPTEIVRMKRVRSASTVRPAVDSAAESYPAPGVPALGGPDSASTNLGNSQGDDRELADLVARYDAALRERGMVDLDDLVTLPTTLLAGDPSLAGEYRSRWTDVFVDEYQDVDEQQYLMLRQLAGPGARICAIGDPDQAIYGFRGGDVGYFLRFQEDFGSAADLAAATKSADAPEIEVAAASAAATAAASVTAVGSSADLPTAAEAAASEAAMTVRLSRSYRSAPTIVRAAMQLIRPGTLVPGRELIPARTDIPDGPVVVHAVADEREEAEAVAAEIEKLLGGASFHALDSRAVDGRDRTEHELSFADFAVLYRTSSQAAAVGEALARRGFPFQRRAHSRLAEMPGVPEILAALSLYRAGTLPLGAPPAPAGCDSEPVIGGPVPQPAGGPTVAELLNEAARRAVADSQSAPEADEAQGAESRAAIRAAADVLGPLAAKCGADLDRFLDELALGAEVDTWDPRADRISLLTLHAAKGLEFPVVFIVGCDDGLLPLRSWRGAEVDYAEERRLLFVGMTRATTRLTLYTAAKRTLRGELTACSPSPFLSSIEPALLDRPGGEAQGRTRRRARVQQTTLF